MNDIKFYDTSSLLLNSEHLKDEPFVISSITLQELEGIKTSPHKDADVKYRARMVTRFLEDSNDYTVHIFYPHMLAAFEDEGFEITNDIKILATAYDYDSTVRPDETIFVTNDLALKHIANLFFGEDCIMSIGEEAEDDYCGYKEVTLNDEGLAELYEKGENKYELVPHEYLVIKNADGAVVDAQCWTEEGFQRLADRAFRSTTLGDIRPMSGDIYQRLAADSFNRNKITMVKGPAGSGKTILSLGYLFSQLEHHKIDKIIVFCNTVATKGSAKLGFYPGTRDEKLLDSQIGNLLSSKLGDKLAVEQLIDQGKLVLLPMSDIRGYDTTNMRAGIYISEAQNLDISLMKLALQRIGEDSVCIIDGDEKTQVDDFSYAGANNGMRRASKIFRGEDVYGEVELKNIHRSRIAAIAEKM